MDIPGEIIRQPVRGIAGGAKKIVLMLSYPADEVGNHLISLDDVENAGVDPYTDVLSLEKYRELFGYKKHRFTGMDYVEYGAQVDGLRMTRTITNLKSGTAYSFYAYVMVGSSRVQSETNTFTTAAQ